MAISKLSIITLFFLFVMPAMAAQQGKASVTFSWEMDAPYTMSEGSSRVDPCSRKEFTKGDNKARGYILHYGLDSTSLINAIMLGDTTDSCLNVGDIRSYTLSLDRGWTYYASIRAFNNAGTSPTAFFEPIVVPLAQETRPEAPVLEIVDEIGASGPTYYQDTCKVVLDDSISSTTITLSLRHRDFPVSQADSLGFRFRKVGEAGWEDFFDTKWNDLSLIRVENGITYEIGCLVYKGGVAGFFSQSRFFNIRWRPEPVDPFSTEKFLQIKINR